MMGKRTLAAIAALWLAGGLAGAGSTSQRWSASTENEFQLGHFDGTALDALGRLTLARRAETVWGPDSGIVWDLVAGRDGAVFAALSNPTRVLRISKSGAVEIWYAGNDDSLVTALAADGKGGVYAGLAPQGRLLHLKAMGESAVLAETGAEFVWSLDRDSDGALWIGSGNPGGVQRFTKRAGLEELWASGDDPVRRLRATRDGVVAGTGRRGRVVRVQRDGSAYVLLDVDEAEIVGLAVDRDGTTFALAAIGERPAGRPSGVPEGAAYVRVTAEAPRDEDREGGEGSNKEQAAAARARPRPTAAVGGELYRLGPEGGWESIWTTTREIPFDLLRDGAGDLLIATGENGRLWRVDAAGRSVRMSRIASNQASALALGADGAVWIGGTSDARVERIAPELRASGTYRTLPIDAGSVARWGRVDVATALPPGAAYTVEVRAGNTTEPDDTWTDWMELPGRDAVPELPAARLLQARVTLRSEGGAAPALSRLSIAYRALNRTPEILAFTIETEGVVVVPGPNATSSALGPMIADDPVARRAADRLTGKRGRQQTRRGYVFGARTFTWSAQDADDDRLRYRLDLRLEGETAWLPIATKLEDEYYSWDSRSIPDGVYRVRLTVDDELDNGAESARRAVRLSDAFTVDNSRPRVEEWREASSADGRRIEFVAVDPGGAIAAVELAVDGGEWRSLDPVDGVADSASERFTCEVGNRGAVHIRVTDGAGNVSGRLLPGADEGER